MGAREVGGMSEDRIPIPEDEGNEIPPGHYGGGKSAHWFGPQSGSSKGEGHPIMFGSPQPTIHFVPFKDGGGYPKGFVEWALREMGCTDPARVLHLCSGSMRTGVRVDIRPEMEPDILADARDVPLPDESFDFIMADPPYSREYALNLYGTAADYPEPGAIAKEACRLLRPGGLFGFLHFQVPMTRKPLRIKKVYGVTTGAGYAIRAWTLMEKTREPSPRLAVA